jgi:peptidoglycan/xylan/chitin deacetylase (PgdA/CDA1 family)
MNRLTGIVLVIFFTFCTLATIAQENSDTVPGLQNELISFVYHRFGESKYASTNISLENFRKQLDYLKENEYHVLTMGEAVSAGAVPERSVVLTVDDGYKSFLNKGLPILQEYGYKATLFINTETIGVGNYLSWEDLKVISDAGIEIGSHSHKHDNFLNYPDDKISAAFRNDLQVSQDLFEKNLGFKPVVYSYPYGEYSKKMKSIVIRYGFICATLQNSGVIDLDRDLYAMPRYPMGGQYATVDGFISKLKMHALPVIWEKPDSQTFTHNPPILEVCIDDSKIREEHIQCFVGSSTDCLVTKEKSKRGIIVRIRSRYKLTDRRTLYKITAPLSNGEGWCWYSHLWVNTGISEQ